LGNLGDISQRALSTLAAVDKIIAEDTRHSRHLLQHFGIDKPLLALHAHNEQDQSEILVSQLKEGTSFALISDAGTPLISDPGYRLVQLAHEAGIIVSPIPGPCAAIAALSALGLPCKEFIFIGFLPAKASQRKAALQEWIHSSRTLVFYEAPHRILETLEDCVSTLGQDRQAGVARELTKAYETLKVGTLNTLLNWMTADPNQQRGEFVLVIGGVEEKPADPNEQSIQDTLKILLAELPLKQAVSLCVSLTGQPKNKVYPLALELQEKFD
jgi:16S rRNA (cytidine1402-2'-O)-methyltransferase